jgi:hypothetical protein
MSSSCCVKTWVHTKFLILFINIKMLRGYGRKRKSAATGGRRKRYVGSALYGYGPLIGYGAVNPWREFIKANKGKFHSFRELAQAYHASKGTGYF